MKKVILFIFCFMAFFSFDNVFAISKEEFLKEIEKGYVINGKEFKLSDEDFVKIKKHINDNNISEENLDFLMRKVDEIVLIIENGDSSSIYELTEEEVNSISDIINEMSAKTGIKLDNKASITETATETSNSITPLIILFVICAVFAGIIVLLKLGED